VETKGRKGGQVINKLFTTVKLVSALAIVVAAVITILVLRPAARQSDNKIKIGAPADTGGLIIHYLVNMQKPDSAVIKKEFELYSIEDCCCSSKSELVLSTELLDAAIICPDAAKRLVKRDKRYELVAPCLVNSEILVVRADKKPTKIGIAQKRDYQKQIVSKKCSPDCASVPMLSASLPYAYEKNSVDGVVIDVLKGIYLDGEKITSAHGQDKVVTYVLIASKAFKNDKRYRELLRLLELA